MLITALCSGDNSSSCSDPRVDVLKWIVKTVTIGIQWWQTS